MDTITTIYLAGPINHASDPHRWRNDIEGATNANNVEYINPLDLEVDLDNPEDIVRTDLGELKRCDAMIIHHEPGVEQWGTPMEAFAASESDLDIHIITWIDDYDGDKDNLSPWLHYVTDQFATTGRDAINKAIRQ